MATFVALALGAAAEETAAPASATPGSASRVALAASGPVSAKIHFSSESFAPGVDAQGARLLVTIDASSPGAQILSWELRVYDPGDQLFATFSGEWPKNTVSWDGRGASGELVESASEYDFVATVRDSAGGVGTATAALSTGIVLLKGAERYRIGLTGITFKPDTADFMDVPAAQRARNRETLRLLARRLKQFGGYRIRIEGHAVLTHWDDPAAAAAEDRNELLPLSKARAEAIRAALVRLGIPAASMVAVGLGGKNPVVPYSDLKNRWKNRRVEIVLEKDEE